NGTGTINNLKNRVIDFQDDNNFASTLTFNNAGFLKKTGGALTTLPGLNNQADGKVDVNAGTLVLGGTGNHDGQFIVAAGSKLAIGAGGQTNSFQAGSSITGDGTTEFAGGTNTLDSGSTYTMAGDTEVSGGATTFNTGSSQNNLTISGGAVSYEENTTTGGYTQSGGVLDGSATVTVNGIGTWSGGTMQGSSTTSIGSAASLTINGSGNRTLDTRRLDNRGQITLAFDNGEELILDNGARIENTSGGQFDITADGVIREGTGSGAAFINRGTLTHDTTAASIDVDFENTYQGTINVDSGTLTLVLGFSRHNSNRGTLDIADTATFAVSSSTVQTFTNEAAAIIRGTGTIDVTDPEVSFVNAGRLQPGNSPGTFTIDGDVTFTASSILEVDLGGTNQGVDYDLLNITGDATLAGTLDAHLFGAFMPGVSDSFSVLNCGGTCGAGATTFDLVNVPLGITFDPVNLANNVGDFSVMGVNGNIRTWIGGSGDWATAGNWKGGIVPVAGDIVHINHAGDLTITVSGTLPDLSGVDIQETLRFDNYDNLTLTGPSTINEVQLYGYQSQLTANADLEVATLRLGGGYAGYLTGSGDVLVTNLFDLNRGTLAGTGQLTVAPSASFIMDQNSTSYIHRDIDHQS
ncbi:MAG: hypothetical protein GY731_16790, partial [Gammaproteobacteria bacterium]|nr:hypothetical protein [Gammaproteobacteria bacterium]